MSGRGGTGSRPEYIHRYATYDARFGILCHRSMSRQNKQKRAVELRSVQCNAVWHHSLLRGTCIKLDVKALVVVVVRERAGEVEVPDEGELAVDYGEHSTTGGTYTNTEGEKETQTNRQADTHSV